MFRHYSLFLILLVYLINISQQQVPGKLSQTTYNIDSSIWDIKWCGKDLTDYERDHSQEVVPKYETKIVFVLSHEGTLYRSADEGKTWSNLQNNLNKLSGRSSSENTFITKIIPSIGDSTTMYFMGNNGVSFYTNDCGRNLNVIKHNKNMADLKPSNTRKEWVLGAVRKSCPSSVQNCPVLFDLYFSDNFGQNWKLIEQWVSEYSWAHLFKASYFIIPEKRIILSRYDIAKDIMKPWSKILNVNVPIKIVYSDDFFQTEKIISSNGVRFYLTKPFLFIMENKDEGDSKSNSTQDDSSYQLSVSYNYFLDYKLQPISVPIERIKDHSFTILDSYEGVAYININHYGPSALFGNIYVSDYSAQKYSLSLLHNVRSQEGYCDFDKMESTEGVFIANHYEHAEAERAKTIYEDEWNTDKSQRKNSLQKIEQYKKSVITYDRGASWQSLIAPVVDSLNQTIECSGECSLHLRGYTDQQANFIYSSKNAIGLIIGVGNTGMYLEASRTSQLNTYMSRDSGLTWQELIKGSHLYEIGDHGGLIVLADDQRPTNEILYSWDEGLNWERYQISDSPIDIQNILIEPTNMASVFLVVGKVPGKKRQEGIIITLDFGSLHQRVCHGLYRPGSDKSDYEFWIPHWHKNDDRGCVMGKKIKYVRRKRESKCWNDEDFEKKVITQYCQCTDEDWECDLGYFREKSDSECKPQNDEIVEKNNKIPEKCNGYYFVTQGYRKIPGDFCAGGVDKSAKRMICPQNNLNQGTQNQIQNDIGKYKNMFNNNNNNNIDHHQKGDQSDEDKSGVPKFYIILMLFASIVLCFRTKIQDLVEASLDKLAQLKLFSDKKQNKYDYELKGNIFGNDDDDL